VAPDEAWSRSIDKAGFEQQLKRLNIEVKPAGAGTPVATPGKQ
jgi:hypothetical protein